ncbi:hypothetical protein B0J18DRAFT_258535 [Chaetomium sp. MPI-SDFR-AT-0129]|nr:hypothetical protein B0J18DRAFT_258535 [Chaetomium sp. MPI-SDFR-AT-0129]
MLCNNSAKLFPDTQRQATDLTPLMRQLLPPIKLLQNRRVVGRKVRGAAIGMIPLRNARPISPRLPTFPVRPTRHSSGESRRPGPIGSDGELYWLLSAELSDLKSCILRPCTLQQLRHTQPSFGLALHDKSAHRQVDKAVSPPTCGLDMVARRVCPTDPRLTSVVFLFRSCLTVSYRCIFTTHNPTTPRPPPLHCVALQHCLTARVESETPDGTWLTSP